MSIIYVLIMLSFFLVSVISIDTKREHGVSPDTYALDMEAAGPRNNKE